MEDTQELYTEKIPLKPGKTTIGRDQSSGLEDTVGHVEIGDSTVSRTHATLTYNQSTGTVTIEDNGSKNGTSVGGKRLEGSHQLSDREVIIVGQTDFMFRLNDSQPEIRYSEEKTPKISYQ